MTRRSCSWQVVLLLAASTASAQPDGKSEPVIQLVGSAERIGSKLRLTPAQRQMAGAAWFEQKQYLRSGFEVHFHFQITEPGGLDRGADGFAFVIQSSGPDAIAGRGSAGGFAIGDGQRDLTKPGIARSLAVFFDTHENSDADDPSDNYIAICTNGPAGSMRWPPNRLGYTRKLPFRLKDTRIHEVTIRYDPPWISVAVEGNRQVLRVPVDLAAFLDAKGSAYVGFTASTGNGYENHDILDWSLKTSPGEVNSTVSSVDSSITFHQTDCMEGRNLCTPLQGQRSDVAPGRFHLLLPAHLAWPILIENPRQLPVQIVNASGYTCFPTSNGLNCSGPAGQSNASTSDRLVPNSNLGAIVSRTSNGKTEFSVNGPIGRNGQKGEGFLEFDVVLGQPDQPRPKLP